METRGGPSPLPPSLDVTSLRVPFKAAAASDRATERQSDASLRSCNGTPTAAGAGSPRSSLGCSPRRMEPPPSLLGVQPPL